MALTPEQNAALMREIDDAVREDNMRNFWTRYGVAVIALVLVVLAAFGGWLYWQHHQTTQAEAQGETFATMLTQAKAAQLDQSAYDSLTKSGDPAYRVDAHLVKAALASGKKDSKTAIAAYDAVLGDSQAPEAMRDLALIRKTALQFDTVKPEQVIAQLKTLAITGNPWFGSAGEMTAIAYLKAGKKHEAGDMFASISRDMGVPQSIRMRAGQMAGMLGVNPQAIGETNLKQEASANAS